MNHLMICSSLDKKPEELNVPVTVVTTWHLPLLKSKLKWSIHLTKTPQALYPVILGCLRWYVSDLNIDYKCIGSQRNLCICTFFHLKGNFRIKGTVRWDLLCRWKKNPQTQSIRICSLKYHDRPVDLWKIWKKEGGGIIKISENPLFLQNETNLIQQIISQ